MDTQVDYLLAEQTQLRTAAQAVALAGRGLPGIEAQHQALFRRMTWLDSTYGEGVRPSAANHLNRSIASPAQHRSERGSHRQPPADWTSIANPTATGARQIMQAEPAPKEVQIVQAIDRAYRQDRRIQALEAALTEVVRAWCHPGVSGTAHQMPAAMRQAIDLLPVPGAE